MKTAKLITRIEEVDASNELHVNDLLNELEGVIFMKNRITEKQFGPEYIGTDQYFKDHATLTHLKLKVISLITTL